jgi:hypothetical protein
MSINTGSKTLRLLGNMTGKGQKTRIESKHLVKLQKHGGKQTVGVQKRITLSQGLLNRVNYNVVHVNNAVMKNQLPTMTIMTNRFKSVGYAKFAI